MEKARVMEALDALAQETRLDLFRLLVRAGIGGMTPTALSRQLKIAPPTLSFHLGRLTHAGLITSRRKGRSIAYASNGAVIDALIAYLDTNLRQPPAPKEPEPKRIDAPVKKPEPAVADPAVPVKAQDG
ncbi:MAG: ArsR family transcriptional regulator [Alphaproteobacteria bacterium]|nr:ArsR family transcriptional regulator [Alphaproteobacteria bacterium]